MKIGTPGFVGARLREGREARGLSGAQLAELLSVTRQAISQFENGERSPSPETLGQISIVLNLPQPFFMRPVTRDHAGTIFFRSKASATKTARTKARRRCAWLQIVTDYITQSIEIPGVNFPLFDFPANPAKITNQDIEDAAEKVRRFWGLGNGPISNVTLLLENNGAVIVRETFGDVNLDAFSMWADDIPFFVLSDDKESAVRSRLDLAHELGHLILHRSVDEARLEKDLKLLEDQAFRFAGAFLLPQDGFANDLYLPTLDALMAVKPKWGVSVGAMLMRADNLGLFSPEQVQRLWVSYGRRRWRTGEPLDDQLPAEFPRLLRLSFELALSEKVVARDDVLTTIDYAPTDIESLAGLRHGTLGDDLPKVRVLTLPSHHRDTRERPATTTIGEVVPFTPRNRTVHRG